MTIVGGIALGVSLVLMLIHTVWSFDPAWITIVVSGLPLLYLAITRLVFQRWISSALLICMAMVACICISEIFAAGEVAFIMAIGALLEEHTVNRAQRGLSKLISLAPQEGRLVLPSGEEKSVAIEQVAVGDILRVLPGERLPVDGIVVEGVTTVDQAILTGESLPVDKGVGEQVFCGTMNCYGSIDIRATKVGADSSLQKMIQLVKEADEKKAPMQRIVDKWATWLVPIALLLAVLAWVVTGEMERGVTVLVVFCPCALALATPVSIIAGIGQATKFGVLIKSGEALERMGQVDTLAFDKTGTITKGSLSVSDMMSVNADMTDEELLMVTASAESRSEHPLGKAIVKESENRGLSLLSVESFEMMPGKGIKVLVDGKVVICGKAGFLEESGIGISPTTIELLDRLRCEGKAIIVTAVDGKCVGVIALSDIVRPDAAKSIEELENIGLSVVLLTGDNGKTASFIASKVGISNVRAELLPAEKLSAIETMQCDGHRVAMVGDGVNDAPALKTADVGIAMGSIGSDIAIESADIALMGDDISLLPYLKKLSNAVTRSIKVNITLSMAINFVAIAMSFLGWLNPVTGALVHNAGSVLVVLNAALLYDRRIKK